MSDKQVRSPAVAGTFYPGRRSDLIAVVDDLLNKASVYRHQYFPRRIPPKILISPHAGYVYSGSVAATAYSFLQDTSLNIRKVLLIAPAHFEAFEGIAAPSVDFFATPLGHIPVDRESISQLGSYLTIDDLPHEKEHSLETQLPFLQRALHKENAEFSIIPLLVGNASHRLVSAVIERLWGGEETVIVISSDLSHGHEYELAQHIDQCTEDKICTKQYQDIDGKMACGHRGLSGALYTATKLGIDSFKIQRINSGDVMPGSKDRVVGYGAFGIGKIDSSDIVFSRETREFLIEVARYSIEYGLEHGEQLPDIDRSEYDLGIQRGVFVTLERHEGGIDLLRGCIGSTQAHKDIVSDTIDNSYSAAFEDTRFPRVSRAELDKLTITISVLSPQTPVHFDTEEDLISKIRPGIDGLILSSREKRGTFLPSVWEKYPEPKKYIEQLKDKAGITEDIGSGNVTCNRYSTVTFSSTSSED